MCRVLAVANVKGGVGKTTTAVNLSAGLAERGRKVLAIDLDPQSSLTVSVGFDPETVKGTILDLLDKDTDTIQSAILKTSEDWDIIPSNADLRGLERELESEATRIYGVAKVLQKIRRRYDYILLDCPANAGILTGAALAAADEVVIPLSPDFLGFKVLGFLIRIIQELQKDINPKLRIAGMFLTMYDSRTRHAREIVAALHNTYGGEIPLFSTIIHQTVRLKEAPSEGKSIIKYAPSSQAAAGYRVIAAEIEKGVRAGSKVYLDAMSQLPQQSSEEAPARDYAAFCRATDLEPQSREAWLGRTQTATRADDAIRSLVKAYQLDTTQDSVRADLEKRLEGYVLDSTSADILGLMGLAQFMTSEGFPHYAERIYHRVTDLDEKNEEAWLARARSTDSPTERVAFIQRCLDINPNNPAAREASAPAKRGLKEEADLLVEQGLALVQSGSMAEAQVLFKRAIQFDPLNDDAWLGCARSAESLPAKLSYVKQAMELNPGNEAARDLYRSITGFMSKAEKDRRSPTAATMRVASLGVVGLLSGLRFH